jgi:hypothetical protein
MSTKKRPPARRRRRPTRKIETWILTNRGFVQRCSYSQNDGTTGKAWPTAATHADAVRLCHYLDVWKYGVRPALIGSVEGESLDRHIEMAIEEGCRYACRPMGWNEDGSPQWGVIDFTIDGRVGA